MLERNGDREQELISEIRETIARAIHENYRQAHVGEIGQYESSMTEWDELLDSLKDSNRQQADHILEKLLQVGCAVHKVGHPSVLSIMFTNREVEIMAEMEHERWNAERLLNGWRLGKKKDATRKITPYLVPWSALPDEVKELDRQPVRNIPQLLAKVGLEVRRQK